MNWYVVHTRIGRELTAATLLEQNLHFDVYLPEVLQRRRGKVQPVPLFPGYLFVRAVENHAALELIDQTPGCGHLVRFGRGQGEGPGTPAELPAGLVARLRRQAEAINDAGGLPVHNLQEGQVVEITSGPLQGFEAVFVGPMKPAARVEVLLRFLGQEQHVEVDADALKPRQAMVKRPRRTRGGGRKIRR
jgi:transcription antitermination factor NusG